MVEKSDASCSGRRTQQAGTAEEAIDRHATTRLFGLKKIPENGHQKLWGLKRKFFLKKIKVEKKFHRL